jgi:hypothetical protein
MLKGAAVAVTALAAIGGLYLVGKRLVDVLDDAATADDLNPKDERRTLPHARPAYRPRPPGLRKVPATSSRQPATSSGRKKLNLRGMFQ